MRREWAVTGGVLPVRLRPTHQVQRAALDFLLARVDVQVGGLEENLEVADGAVDDERHAALTGRQHAEH